MTVNYTTNLALGQPVTGTESGTWGDDVNNSVTSYLDIAIAGGLSVTITTTDVTLTLTQGTSSATNIGSTTAQYAILNVSGAMTAARNLILPSSSRQYVINNNTTGGFALTVKGSATSGVTMVNGEKAHVFWNGSDYAKVANTAGVATFTDLTYTGTLTGSTGVIAIGTNQIYKDSSGNVGIGTSSPGVKLDVSGVIRSTGTSAILAFSKRSTGTGDAWGMYSQSGEYNIYDYTAGVSRLVIDSSGNVGIGASSTGNKLEVSSSTQNIVVSRSTGSYGAFQRVAPTGQQTYDFYTINGVEVARITGDPSYLAFSTGSAATERMRIDSSGNVGIGTSSPGAKLDVAGNIRLSSGSPVVQFNNGGPQIYVTAANTLQFSINSGSSEAMRIDSSGNVGIGTNSPGYKLHVANSSATSTTLLANVLARLQSNASGADASLQFSDNVANSAGISLNQGALVFSIAGGSVGRFDTSGNLGIGTSSPSTYAKLVSLGADNATTFAAVGATNMLRVQGYNSTYVGTVLEAVNLAQSANTPLFINGSTLKFGISGTTQATIDSSGNLLVGTTSGGGAGGVTIYPLGNGAGSCATQVFNKSNTTSDSAIQFRVGGSTVSGISYTSTLVTYGTVSDYRAKNVIGSVIGSGERIDALEPIEYEWKIDGSRTHGFLAHKFQEVYPNSVTGTKDAVDAEGKPVYQGMQASTSEVIADLVAEIQSLRKRLAALEAR